MSVQLGRHESHVDQLLKQSSLLMETVCNLQSAMTEHSVPIPINLGAQWLAARQRLLSAQVLAEKQMPLLSKEIQVRVHVHVIAFRTHGINTLFFTFLIRFYM